MNGSRLRLLVMASTFPRWRGDTEPPFVYNLSSGLAEQFDVTVLAPHAQGAKTNEQWGKLDVSRFRYFWPAALQKLAYGGILPNLKRNKLLWLLVPFFLLGEFIATLRLTQSKRIDVLHAHWLIPQGFIAVLVGMITRTPVVATCHAADLYALRGRFTEALKRWVLGRCSYYTVVSEDLLQESQKLGIKVQIPASVISMGVDTSAFSPQNRDEKIRSELNISGPFILFVGRLTEKKGVRYLLSAMPKVLDSIPDATLVIVGDGDLRPELEELANSLGISQNVRFVGAKSQDALTGYYATADVFVGPSITAESGDREGLPVTFIEALASGCAVVCSNIGGAREVVIDNETGILVPERDSVAIANAVIFVLGDAELRKRLQESGLAWVRERFDQAAVASRYADVISEVARATS